MNRIDRAIQRRMKKISADSMVYLKLYDQAHEDDKFDIYYESKQKEYQELIPIRAVVRYNPSEKIIADLGMDNRVEVIVRVSKKKLQLAGLVDGRGQPDFALDRDRFIVDEQEYEIIHASSLVQYQGQQRMVAIGGIRL